LRWQSKSSELGRNYLHREAIRIGDKRPNLEAAEELGSVKI
jgi:hypothetical protein